MSSNQWNLKQSVGAKIAKHLANKSAEEIKPSLLLLLEHVDEQFLEALEWAYELSPVKESQDEPKR